MSRDYPDDDGRTIADMSEVSGPSMFAPRRSKKQHQGPQEAPKAPQRPWEDQGYNRKERRMVILGALKAALVIALAYIVGFAALIALLLYLWK
jgi:hypothetical protein